MIPTRHVGLVHADELELHHEPLVLGEVLHLAMPDVVMDQQEPTRFQATCNFRHQRLFRTLRLVLAARDHAGGATLERRGLRHVHDHRPTAAVVAHAAQIAPVAVLVDALRIGARQVVVQRAVRMHHVITTDHAGQGATHDGVGEDLVQLRHGRQQVVAGVEIGLGADERVESLPDGTMETVRQFGTQAEIAVRDEALHLGVGEQFRGGHRRGLRYCAQDGIWHCRRCALDDNRRNAERAFDAADFPVIASGAKQSPSRYTLRWRLPRRCAPRNDSQTHRVGLHPIALAESITVGCG